MVVVCNCAWLVFQLVEPRRFRKKEKWWAGGDSFLERRWLAGRMVVRQKIHLGLGGCRASAFLLSNAGIATLRSLRDCPPEPQNTARTPLVRMLLHPPLPFPVQGMWDGGAVVEADEWMEAPTLLPKMTTSRGLSQPHQRVRQLVTGAAERMSNAESKAPCSKYKCGLSPALRHHMKIKICYFGNPRGAISENKYKMRNGGK